MAPIGGHQGPFAPGIDDVHDAFCFCQIQPAVQESPFGEFAGLRRPGPCPEGQGQDFLQGLPPAMALDLAHIFPGIGMGPGHVHGQHLVHHLALFVQDVAVTQLPGSVPAGFLPAGEQLVRNGKAVRPAEPDHADGTHPQGSGDGTDGILKNVHDSLQKTKTAPNKSVRSCVSLCHFKSMTTLR